MGGEGFSFFSSPAALPHEWETGFFLLSLSPVTGERRFSHLPLPFQGRAAFLFSLSPFRGEGGVRGGESA